MALCNRFPPPLNLPTVKNTISDSRCDVGGSGAWVGGDLAFDIQTGGTEVVLRRMSDLSRKSEYFEREWFLYSNKSSLEHGLMEVVVVVEMLESLNS